MDPEKTLREMLVFYALGNLRSTYLADAQESAKNLRDWLSRGGYVPTLDNTMDKFEVQWAIHNILSK